MFLKAFRDGESIFVRSDDEFAKQVFKNKYENRDLLVSPNLYTAPDLSAEQICPLRFHIVAENLMQACKNTIEACYYLTENFAIPEDVVDVIYCGGGITVINKYNKNTLIAEMVIIISPIIFGCQSIQLMPVINYHLTRDLVRAGIKNIDIDVYHQDKLLRMPNLFNSATSRYAIPLTLKELLYISPDRITELAQNPRPEDSMVIPRCVPEAVKWFNEIHSDFAKKHEYQNRLLNLMLQSGWKIPECIRKLQKLYLYGNTRLEVYRIIAQFYSWIKSSIDEIRYQIQDLDHRNSINDIQKLRAIITFATQNPYFASCEHKLLKCFCPAGKCFMAKLKDNYKNHSLFEQI